MADAIHPLILKKNREHVSGCLAGVDDVEFGKDQPDVMVTE